MRRRPTSRLVWLNVPQASTATYASKPLPTAVIAGKAAQISREPAGLVRLSSPVLLTQRCLAHALPAYMATHPKVSVFVEPTDLTVNVIEEPFDIAIRAKPEIEDVAGLVAKTLGTSQRVLVVSPAFLDHSGRPEIGR